VEGVYSVTVCDSEGDMDVGGRSIVLKDPEVVGAFIRALKAETAPPSSEYRTPKPKGASAVS
jgi:hypothetical protein